MPLINIVLTLILVGICLWAINQFIPMAASVKKILNVVVIVFVCFWLLQVLGVINGANLRLN